MSVCKQVDDFITEKLHWVVTLSNGETIYQDDGRPDEIEPSAWIRLKKYVQENELSIESIHLVFCDHIEEVVPRNADGYYFVQKVMAFAFSGENQNTFHYYLFGAVVDGELRVYEWMVPEILPVSQETRKLDLNDEKLILNFAKQNG